MNYKDKYFFPAVLEFDKDGISVFFPDLPGALTCGDDEEEAVYNAKECMELHLYNMELDNDEIPKSTKVKDIKLETNQAVLMVTAFMTRIRSKMNNKSVKKTLTIPKWMDEEGQKRKYNFSKILQKALKEKFEEDGM